MICNPAQTFAGQGANPFEAWQKLWMQGLTQLQATASQAAPSPAPVDMFGQLQAMQAMWMNMLAPQQAKTVMPVNPFMPFSAMPQAMPMQAPKITVTTIELGDMRPYMEMANNMLQTFAPMLTNAWGRK